MAQKLALTDQQPAVNVKNQIVNVLILVDLRKVPLVLHGSSLLFAVLCFGHTEQYMHTWVQE